MAAGCAACGIDVDPLRDPARVVDGRVVTVCTLCVDAPIPSATADEPAAAAAPRPEPMASRWWPVAIAALLLAGLWSARGDGLSGDGAPLATHAPARWTGDRRATRAVPTPRPAAAHRAPRSLRPATARPRGDSRHWRLTTDRGPVHVWAPPGYDPDDAAIVLYVHGYDISVDDAWRDHRLAEQFWHSGRNALFIAPAGPRSNDDDLPWPSTDELFDAVRDRIDLHWPSGIRIAIGHSGAFRAIARWASRDPIDHVILLDALYGGERRFHAWLEEFDIDRRLTIVAHATIDNADDFTARYPGAVIRDVGRDFASLDDDAREARILYLRTREGHFEILTDGVALPALLAATYAEPITY